LKKKGSISLSHYTKHVFLCTNQKAAGKKCCANGGADECFEYIRHQLIEKGLHGPGKIRVSKSGCLGRCSKGPCIVVYPDAVWYNYASHEDIDEIINHHLIDGRQVEHLLID